MEAETAGAGRAARAALDPAAPRAEARAEVRHGRLRGTREAGVEVFRGIPYAAPPVGALRFRPPRPVDPWPGVRDATRFGPAAPQLGGTFSEMLGTSAAEASEDCLTLNVWTPAADAGRRPVLVWLHGGGFNNGAGSQSVYDGARLARRGDVVVVTLNYRLGALGWLALPGPSEDGGALANFGLLDQIAALEWVRDEIAAFGGDPGRVTLFGESAGAMSVGTLLGCPRAAGLFARAILQSGAAHNVHAPDTAARVRRALLGHLGLDEGPDLLRRLRALPVEAILAAQKALLESPLPEVRQLRFQPVLDGEVLPEQPLDAVAAGRAAGVSVLAGTNLDEYRLWGLTDPKASRLDLEALLRRCRRTIPGAHPRHGPHAERVVHTYREARRGRDSVEPPDLWFAIESDRIFRAPAMRLLELQAPHAPALYAYLFTWASPALGGVLGSCHALEVPFVFGDVESEPVRRFVGSGARPLSDRMQEAWLAFARDGAPPGWPAYDARERLTRIFGPEPGVERAPQESERAVWDGILEP